MAMIFIEVSIAVPIQYLIVVVIVYLSLCFRHSRPWRGVVHERRTRNQIDISSDSTSTRSEYESIDEIDSVSSREVFELWHEFYKHMDEDELFNVDNYLDREQRM